MRGIPVVGYLNRERFRTSGHEELAMKDTSSRTCRPL